MIYHTQYTNNNNFMYKQNQNITFIAKDGSATQITINQAKKLFASTNHFDFDNIKSPPPKTKI